MNQTLFSTRPSAFLSLALNGVYHRHKNPVNGGPASVGAEDKSKAELVCVS